MHQDAQLLADLDPKGEPILHLYDWSRPAATYGYFLEPARHVKGTEVELARRSTGGGIVFHLWDLAFSFLMPADHPNCSQNTLENYRFVNRIVLDAVEEIFSMKGSLIPENAEPKGPHCANFCMARPTIYDAVYRGMKVAGAAQRRTRRGFLHQGSISLALPDPALLERVLVESDEIAAAMAVYSFAPLGNAPTPQALRDARQEIQAKLAQKFALAVD